MRRLFWVGAGAMLGVTGYRRVSRLARAVGKGGRPGAAPGSGLMHGDWRHGGLALGAARFARDVRDGMELYADRHPGLAGRTLEGQQAGARPHRAGPGEEGHGGAYPGTDYAKDGR